MATAENEVITGDDDAEQTVLFRKAMSMLAKSQQMIIDATAMLESMTDKSKRKIKVQDENGEPTWTYLVKQGIPKDFRLTKKFIAYAAEYGFDERSAGILMNGMGTYEGFIKYYRRVSGQSNGKWTHWSLVWEKWVRKERERKDQAASGARQGTTRFDQQRTRG